MCIYLALLIGYFACIRVYNLLMVDLALKIATATGVYDVGVLVVCVCFYCRSQSGLKKGSMNDSRSLMVTKKRVPCSKEGLSLSIGCCVGIITCVIVFSHCCEGVYCSTSLLVPF